VELDLRPAICFKTDLTTTQSIEGEVTMNAWVVASIPFWFSAGVFFLIAVNTALSPIPNPEWRRVKYGDAAAALFFALPFAIISAWMCSTL
jgi:hypothetical protein